MCLCMCVCVWKGDTGLTPVTQACTLSDSSPVLFRRKGLKPSLEPRQHISTPGSNSLNIKAFKSGLNSTHLLFGNLLFWYEPLWMTLTFSGRKHKVERLNNSHWTYSTYCSLFIMFFNVVGTYVQAIKVTRRRSVSLFHMICDSWLFLCPCQQSNIFNALFRIATPAQWQPVVCHCPNWLTHCPLFSFKVPRSLSATCICDKHHYLSWERARSQLEGSSAAGFNVFCRWLKVHPALWTLRGLCSDAVCAAVLYKHHTPPAYSSRLIALTL